IDVHGEEMILRDGDERLTLNMKHDTASCSNHPYRKSVNLINIFDLSNIDSFNDIHPYFDDDPLSGSPTPSDDQIVSTTSPPLTPFRDSNFLLFEDVDAFLGLEDDPDSPKIDPSYYDPEGDILLLEAILNSDPSPPLPNHDKFVPSFKDELKACEAKTIKSSIDEPPELPVIIAKALKDENKSAMIKVLKSHKRAIAWKLSDIQGTFQRCMLAIFHDMVEKTMEVFMDDFSVFGNSFKNCLSHLDKMLQRCEDTKLCLNWEKSHFMVKEGIVLGHKISKNGIKVDKAKIDVIAKLPHPTTVKGVLSFLGHA
nr:reverse transcriptase domain-containing protein [Tanacetum cinerariifolium]GFB44155.1 reverse transcriptase domain-containing protein [Tanacetum cinerariifolium]